MRIDTYNLSALSERLMADKRHGRLAGAIKEAVRYHSLRTDLIMAEESCAALSDLLAMVRGDQHQSITESALLCNAIVLYARATHTKSGGRDPIDLLHRFTPEQRKVHDEINGLRDQAVAHYGSGGSYQGEWKNEIAILQFKHPEESKVGVATVRLAVDRKLTKRIRDQIAVARSMVDEITGGKLNLVTDEINKIVAAEPDFHREVGAHPLNLSLFLKDTKAAESARAAFDSGYAMGVVEH